jgi:hypothetical protein
VQLQFYAGVRLSVGNDALALRPAHSRRHLYVTGTTEGFSHFVTSMTAPVASGWSGWPGGACTGWKAPPCHGAHVERTSRVATSHGFLSFPSTRRSSKNHIAGVL